MGAALCCIVTGTKRKFHRPRSYPVTRRLPAINDLYATRPPSTIVQPSQKVLTAAVAHEAYIVWWAKVSAFDAAHPDSPIRDREARRLVDVSQPGAAAWLRITPDRTVPHSRPDSATTTTGVERHLGLYLTSGQPGFDAMEAAGHEVTDSDRLGDTAINAKSTNKSPRHNKLNRAVRDAIFAKSTTPVILGDKGDGRPLTRALARQRYGWANDGHVPDIIHKHAAANGNHVLYETKCYTSLKTYDALGHGSSKKGGAATTAMGHLVPFGCCEEKLLVEIYGTRGRGAPADPPFDHATGEGRVDARVGYYVDAIHKKKNTVVMILANPFGGMHSTLAGLLSHLDKKKGVDYTHYGENSTKSFYTHHMNAISVACVTGEAEAINWAISRAETRFSGVTA